jgi:hypothetical protein
MKKKIEEGGYGYIRLEKAAIEQGWSLVKPALVCLKEK